MSVILIRNIWNGSAMRLSDILFEIKCLILLNLFVLLLFIMVNKVICVLIFFAK